MTEPRLSRRDPELTGLEILVVGLGKSGLAAARLALAKGARVRLADAREEAALGENVARARAEGAEVLCGGHPPALAGRHELIVVSPGVPLDHPLFVEARRLGVPVWGEVELASRFCAGRIIGITGSNGKSTVTSMTGAILRAAGITGGTGGNLGTPFSGLMELDGPRAVHALELSSFQLDSIETFRAHVAVIVNLSPDHLDRYASYEHYARSKARLLLSQQSGDHAVLNADDVESRRFERHVRGTTHRFSTESELPNGAYVRGGRLVLSTEAGEEPLIDASTLPVPGRHNQANALAAALACRLVGCDTGSIARGLAGYRALPHRLQHVGTVRGVTFYNDSKATNVDAASRALASFPPASVHLILGGRDKGADWSVLAPLVRRHAKRVLLVGEAAAAIARALADVAEPVDCGTVEKAVRLAFGSAAPGDVVLLSPACASFDQYANFEERGVDFSGIVQRLSSGGSGRA